MVPISKGTGSDSKVTQRSIDPKQIDVVLICGGLGTRLRSIEPELPKGMVPIEGRPFLQIVIDQLHRLNFSRFILCTGYKSEDFKKYFGSIKEPEIVISEEKTPLGTAGAVKLAENYIKSDQVLALNGDSVCTVDWESLVKFHASHNGLASLTVTKNQERSDVGGIEFDKQFAVTQFVEKRGRIEPHINAGVYMFERRFLSLIPANQKVSLEEQIFPKMELGTLFAYVSDAKIYDIGTPERLDFFKNLYKSGRLTK